MRVRYINYVYPHAEQPTGISTADTEDTTRRSKYADADVCLNCTRKKCSGWHKCFERHKKEMQK